MLRVGRKERGHGGGIGERGRKGGGREGAIRPLPGHGRVERISEG